MALNLSCELVELMGLEFLCIIEVAGDPYFVAAREVRAGKYVGSESGKRLGGEPCVGNYKSTPTAPQACILGSCAVRLHGEE
jgi:hypothetical protein